jgi:hypothetical protein
MLLHHPEQLLTYRNDSLMLVLEGICIEDTVITDVRYYGLQLFKKKGRYLAQYNTIAGEIINLS